MSHSLLVDALAAGAIVVTPNNRLARDVVLRFDASRRAQRLAAWSAAQVLPWSLWLDRLWLEALAARAGGGRVLLDAGVARELWYAVVKDERRKLLNPRGAARHDGVSSLILAPMRAKVGTYAASDPVYKWLGTLDAAEEIAELGRLLYVGATRARKRLHLTAVAEAAPDAAEWKRPARGTPLERLWDALVAPPPPSRDEVAEDAMASLVAEDSLLRVPVDLRLAPLPAPLPVALPSARTVDALVFDWADAIAAAIGTVAHRLLAQIAVEGLAQWDERRLQREQDRIFAELGSEGLEPDVRPRAAQRVAAVIARTLSDPRGRWLFDPSHSDARSEWALAGEDDGRIVHIIVDRSFIADGCRYVVDFKTGAHLGGNPAIFLQQEFARYRPQLDRYARIVRALEPRPVRIALYHPLVDGGWQQLDAG